VHFDIDATGAEFSLEARAYLEFRLFSALSRFGTDVFAVRIRLRDHAAVGAPPCIQCRVHVLLRPDSEAVVEASANRLYAAIDQGANAAEAAVDECVGSRV
jgi:hypothetical protein